MNIKTIVFEGIRGILNAIENMPKPQTEDKPIIAGLDTCKFQPQMKCLKAKCPAWHIHDEGGICTFDLVTTAIQSLAPVIKEIGNMLPTELTDKLKNKLKTL